MRRAFLLSLFVLCLGGVAGFEDMLKASIQPHTGPQLMAFRAVPASLRRGEVTTLSWAIRGADWVDISWAPERNPRGHLQSRISLPIAGNLTFRPQETTAYVIECRSRTGEQCMAASLTVEVKY